MVEGIGDKETIHRFTPDKLPGLGQYTYLESIKEKKLGPLGIFGFSRIVKILTEDGPIEINLKGGKMDVRSADYRLKRIWELEVAGDTGWNPYYNCPESEISSDLGRDKKKADEMRIQLVNSFFGKMYPWGYLSGYWKNEFEHEVRNRPLKSWWLLRLLGRLDKGND